MAAAALLLLSPPVVLAESRAGVEIPLMFCIVLFIERLQHAWNEDRTRDWIVAGIVLGLAALVRSTPLLFAVILLPIMWVAMYRNTSVRRIISRWDCWSSVWHWCSHPGWRATTRWLESGCR